MAPPEVRFTVAKRQLVASVSHVGAYGTIQEDMTALKGWLERNGAEQTGFPFCLFFDNPIEKPVDRLRSEACIPVLKGVRQEGRFTTKELPEVQVAETRHEGPPEKFYMTYGPFLEGLLKSGYRLLGPAREYYRTVSDAKGPGSGFLIHQPISKP